MKKIFNDGVDYKIQTPERPYKYVLEDKTIIYLSLEQLRFMKKDYWEEKKEKTKISKCIIGSDKNGLIRCKKDCKNCKWYKTPQANNGIVSLDKLIEDNNYEIGQPESEGISIFKTKYAHERLREAIDNLEDSKDRLIMNLKLEGLNETEIAIKLNVSQRAIAKRRKKIYLLIYEEIKDLRD